MVASSRGVSWIEAARERASLAIANKQDEFAKQMFMERTVPIAA